MPDLSIYAVAAPIFHSQGLILWIQKQSEIYSLLASMATLKPLPAVGIDIYEELTIARRFPMRV